MTWRKRNSLLFLLPVLLVLLLGWQCAAQETVTLTLWHHWDGQRTALLDEVLRRFEEAYPWIKVQAELKPHPTMEQLLMGIMSGTGPDVAMMEHGDSVSLGLTGGLLSIADFVEKEGINLSEIFYPPVIDTLQNNPLVPGGDYYYLPLEATAGYYLYYNKGLFELSGLDPNNSLPTTWSELEAVGRKLVFQNPDGTLAQVGIDVAAPTYNWIFNMWLNTAGGYLYSDDLRTVVLNDPASQGLLTLEWMVDFTNNINQGNSKLRQVGNPWALTRFMEEKAAMLAGGPYNYYSIRQQSPQIDLGMAPIPYRDGHDYHPYIGLGWGYGILAATQHPEEAWLLLKWLTMEVDGGGYLTLQQGRPGATIEVNLQPEYFDANPYWHVIQDSFNRSIQAKPTPPLTGAPAVLLSMVQKAVNFEMTPYEAIEWATHELQKQLDDFWTASTDY
ncbi:MAG TPA: extracellular solute-binding protein [Firmicutes bacterium]|nr:extracellular solute-binding protein [Bacillota bacterium]